MYFFAYVNFSGLRGHNFPEFSQMFLIQKRMSENSSRAKVENKFYFSTKIKC